MPFYFRNMNEASLKWIRSSMWVVCIFCSFTNLILYWGNQSCHEKLTMIWWHFHSAAAEASVAPPEQMIIFILFWFDTAVLFNPGRDKSSHGKGGCQDGCVKSFLTNVQKTEIFFLIVQLNCNLCLQTLVSKYAFQRIIKNRQTKKHSLTHCFYLRCWNEKHIHTWILCKNHRRSRGLSSLCFIWMKFKHFHKLCVIVYYFLT